MPTISTRPVAVKLDAAIHERIKHLAENRHRTTHWMMREAIQQYVEREEKRDAYRQAALVAWEEYQQTGVHATAEEVTTWLESWGTDQEQPAPVCHK